MGAFARCHLGADFIAAIEGDLVTFVYPDKSVGLFIFLEGGSVQIGHVGVVFDDLVLMRF